MFNLNDRVQLRDFQCTDYTPKDICTVMAISNGTIGILSDNDDDRESYLWVFEKDIVHVTNVPSVRPRGSDVQPKTEAGVRKFGTGATRDLDANKLDYEGFLSPLVLKRYAEHMHRARKMPDGSMRDSDNWQLGIPQEAYVKSLFRHFFSVWSLHRGVQTFVTTKDGTAPEDIESELCAVLFNASGMLHEILKGKLSGTSV